MRSIIIYISLFFASYSLSAQYSDVPKYFRHYTIEDGLSNNWVYNFLEDDLGFLWVGTRDGLNRFDGYTFKTYDETNSALQGDNIRVLFQGKDQTIWVGTSNSGLYRYSWETGLFTPVRHDNNNPGSIESNRITSLAKTDDEHLWVGTMEGDLNLLNINTLEAEQPEVTGDVGRVMALAAAPDSVLWIGAWNGLYRYDRESDQIEKISWHDEESPHGYNRIIALHFDKLGRLWVGTNGAGLYYVDIGALELRKLPVDSPELNNSAIRKITSLPDGRILLGTINFGVVYLDPVLKTVKKTMYDPDNERSILNNSVYDILIDRFGSLWVANDASGGINYYHPHDRRFHPVLHTRYKPNTLSNSNVRSIYQDKEGRIWMGTREGLNLKLQGKDLFKSFPIGEVHDGKSKALTILSMEEDSRGNFWIGTFSGGVKIFDRSTGKVTQLHESWENESTLKQAHVYDIMEDSRRQIWLATMGGAYLLSPDGIFIGRYTKNNSELGNSNVRVLIEDRRGKIWLGARKGLNYYDPDSKRFRQISYDRDTVKNISTLNIFCLYEDDGGRIWAGTEGGGIKIIDHQAQMVETISREDGLTADNVNAILKDENGYYWISTNLGIYRYNENNGEILHYTVEDGLQSNDFFPNSSLHSEEGELFFGGPKGMNHFDPEDISINTLVPEVVFTDLYLKNQVVTPNTDNGPLRKPLPMTSELVLRHDQTSISIHFAGLGYINPQKYLYSSYLEGLDETWSTFDDQRFAIFNNLTPGRYTLHVRIKNSDNQIGKSDALLRIRVLPAPWASWYAYAIYVFIIIGLLLLFRSYTLSWAKIKTALELEKKEKKQIQELNTMKLRFFTNISHEFKTPLTLLKGYVESLRGTVRDKKGSETLSNIDRNSDRLLKLVNELMEFRKAESGILKLRASQGDLIKYTREICDEFKDIASRQGIEFNFNSDQDSELVWFDPGKIEKVLFNLLSNAFKFTDEGGAIDVFISKPASSIGLKSFIKSRSDERIQEWIEIVVSDSGTGIEESDLSFVFDRYFQASGKVDDMSSGTGIGLAYSRRLVEMHHGNLMVSSKKGEGSVFIVRLPLGSDHLLDDEKYSSDRERFYLRIDYDLVLRDTFEEEVIDEEPQALTTTGPRVVIIEDNMQIINLLKDILSPMYTIFFAVDGETGLKLVEEKYPDIVISDIMMPGISGIDVCRHLKSNAVTSHIPLILLTARSGESTRIEGLNLGADAYLSKPFSTELLIATMENIISIRKRLKAKFSSIGEITPSEITRNSIDEQFLDKVITYVEDHVSDPGLDVLNLCDSLGMSRSALYRKIKYLTGHSIQEFIRKIRLRKAKQYLVNTDKSVAEVSYLVGFSNAKNFSTSFRKAFDVPPSEFRK